MLTHQDLMQQISQNLHVFWVSLLVCVMTGTLAWRQGFFHWDASSVVAPHLRGKDVFKAFLYFILMQVFFVPALVIVGFVLWTGQSIEMAALTVVERGWINVLTVLGGLIGIGLVFIQLPLSQRRAIWGQSSNWYQQLAIGAMSWFISYPLVLAINQLITIAVLFFFQQKAIDQVAVKHFKYILHEPLLFWLTALLVIVIVPVVEELLFRGFLQNWLAVKLKGTKKAIVLTSLIFAVFHFSYSQGMTNIELLSSLFVLSCFLGFLYEKQRSLWASIGLHACFNGLSVLMIIAEK